MTRETLKLLAGEQTISRERIVCLARRWIGTPYHHQASAIHIGVDCLGLVRGVWRQLYGFDVASPPAYSPDWAEATGQETLLEGAGRYLEAVEPTIAMAGDVIVFRLRRGVAAKHAAILTSQNKFIHAMEHAAVREVQLSQWWRRRIAGTFAFPGVN